MKFKAQLSGSEHDISLDLDNERACAEIDGRDYEIDIRELTPGDYLVLQGSNVHKCRVETKHNSRDTFEVILRGLTHDIRIVDPKRLRSGQVSGGHDHGSAEIVSPMPGKVVRVLVEPGARVEAEAGIIVVEAMKMQNELKAPKAGMVVSINAEAGTTVNAGEVLAVIE